MPARRIKSLYPERGHQRHREHRSKRGRQYGGKRDRYYRAQYRLRLEDLQIADFEADIELNV